MITFILDHWLGFADWYAAFILASLFWGGVDAKVLPEGEWSWQWCLRWVLAPLSLAFGIIFGIGSLTREAYEVPFRWRRHRQDRRRRQAPRWEEARR